MVRRLLLPYLHQPQLTKLSPLTRPQFDASLAEAQPPTNFGPELASLWWITNKHWQDAHDLIDGSPGPDCAWIHAYLHRIEGDEANARYWYLRSGKDKPDYGLARERDVLLEYFLGKQEAAARNVT